jgi:eukaryotic-like serine/threonine-protein kinase
LLTKVKNFWVKGVLEKSLHQQVLISLGLEERPEAIASPWNLMLGTDERSPQELPPGTSVISVFDQIGEGRTLLILGEPGSGKTISLLQLARDLIDRAEQDVDQLIPVVFNLSSWSAQRQPLTLADWLVAELNNKYQVSRRLAKDWVEQQQLRLLLDGLDEVRAENRDACVAAINAFQQEQGTEVIVCSRIKDYDRLTHRLNFQRAIHLRSLTQPQIDQYLTRLQTDLTGLRSLTQPQIDQYLTRLQTDLTGLRSLLSQDTALQELAHSPLMLNIMVLAYQGVAIEDLPKTNVVEERRKQLFNTYIQRMFDRPTRSKSNSRYSQAETLRWLSWLAQRMVQKSPTMFLIENMQPTWLQTKTEERVYRIEAILLFGLSSGLLFGLSSGLSVGLIVGLSVGLIGGLRGEIRLVETLSFSAQKAIQEARWTLAPLIGGLVGGLVGGLISGLSVGLVGGLVGGLISGLSVGLIFGLLGGLIVRDLETKAVSNQGIWSSARNFMIFGLISGLTSGLGGGLSGGLISGLISGLNGGLISGLSVGLSSGLIFGLISGLIVGLNYGGAACVQHFSLRLLLCHKGRIPWNYACFLDDAVDRLFLQKVGGGYIFVHRLLMEHFAQLQLENEE